VLGILGGLGPAATIDLMATIVALTPATADMDHVPVVAISDPRVPSLGAAILRDGRSPVPELLRAIRRLEAAGAEQITIACHAAFHWYDELSEHARVPILHIGDAVVERISESTSRGATIGLLAAASTLQSAFYQRRLSEAGFGCVVPDDATQEQSVSRAIELVKQGATQDAIQLLDGAFEHLRGEGAETIVLACTEISAAMKARPYRGDARLVDGTEALAVKCIDWWKHREKLEL
jgi:aspartate racemase